jgi:hypothetical protein
MHIDTYTKVRLHLCVYVCICGNESTRSCVVYLDDMQHAQCALKHTYKLAYLPHMADKIFHLVQFFARRESIGTCFVELVFALLHTCGRFKSSCQNRKMKTNRAAC